MTPDTSLHLSRLTSLEFVQFRFPETDDLAYLLPSLPNSVKELRLLSPTLGSTIAALREVATFLSRSSKPRIVVYGDPQFFGADPQDILLWRDHIKGIEFVNPERLRPF